MLKPIQISIVLFFALGCTNSYNVHFRLDERYLNSIPQYLEGRSFINSSFDTLTFTLTSVESIWLIVGYDPSDERYYAIQQKKFNYAEKNNPDISFYIELRTYPDLELNKVAGTELVWVGPSNLVPLRLAFLPTDTLPDSPSTFIGDYVVQGKLYEHVYGNASSFLYSADGELLRFKLQNDVLYEVLLE